MGRTDATFYCPKTDHISRTLPPPERALSEPNGLLAIGGDLAPNTLIAAYRVGVFPWYSDGQPLLWWSPDPRCVLRPAEFHLSRSLLRDLRRRPWRITLDRDFTRVMRACAAERHGHRGTWITDDMLTAYTELYRLGYAHSLECWLDDGLAGGIYGVAIGQVFFGESMFSRVTNGSKVALYALTRRLHAWGYSLLDCQVANPHLHTLGAVLMPRMEFSAFLQTACGGRVESHAWCSLDACDVPP